MNYFKFLLILSVFGGLTTKAQSCGEDKFIDICNKLIRIDSAQFKEKFAKSSKFPKTKRFKKVKSTITIPTKENELIFKDDWRPANYTIYSLYGEDTLRHWVVVTVSDYNWSDAKLINTESGKIWEIICEPKQIYSDKIVCFEYPLGGAEIIQVLSFKGNEIIEDRHFKICNCSANFGGINKMYYSNKRLFFKDGINNYYKVNIDF